MCFQEILRDLGTSSMTLEVKVGPLSIWMVCGIPYQGDDVFQDYLSHHTVSLEVQSAFIHSVKVSTRVRR